MLDCGLENLELNIVCGYRVRDSIVIEEQFLHLLTLIDEKIHVTPIINNQIRSMILTIILWLHQRIQDSVTLLLNTLTLTEKHRSRFIMSNESHSVILVRKKCYKSTKGGH